VQLAGIYTHFATADEADTAPAREQGRRFLSAVDQAGGRDGLALHAANSAALLAIPQLHLDMVRPGLAIYGYDPRGQGPRADLRPALRLTARLMQVKQAAAGSSCGYGLSHRFDRDTLVGLVPVGYADGYMRCLSNKAIMRVRGADCPVRGRVSMDQTIIDLSAVAGAKVGDEVEIIGPDPAAPNSIENLARQAGTIPYEVLVRLGQRVHRTLVP
jgi:alanine racemase